MSNELVVAKNAIAGVSTGKQANQDAFMTMWCNGNWGDLLQPAPLSIALLGSVLVIASATDDFSLITERDPTDTSPPVIWEYAKYPDSFKSCLQQMVGDGYEAFEGAHSNMERINNASSQIPQAIREAVTIILKASPEEARALLPNQIEHVLGLAEICKAAAKSCETAFMNISGLAQELVLACTHKAGTDQQKLEANRVHLEVLQVRKEQEELALKQAKDHHEMVKKSFLTAESDFHDAIKNVPSGWDIVEMQVVETLTSLAVSAGNAAISAFSFKSRALDAGLGAFSNSTLGGGKEGAGQVSVPADIPSKAPNGIPTQNNTSALSDPGLLTAQSVLNHSSTIQQLIQGGPNGEPDWTKIRGKDDSRNGGEYVKASLENLRDRLNPGKPISAALSKHIAEALQIITSIIKVAKSAQTDPNALNAQKPKIEKLISDLQELVTSTNSILKQSGSAPAGPATPAPPMATASTGAAKIAVENSKFVVDQTRSNLSSSRDAMDKSAERLAEDQKAMTKTIAETTSLSLSNATLEKMLPVLKKAVGAFTTLRAQFSQLLQFFHSVASLLTDVMGPSIDHWAKTMNTTLKLGGVTVSDFMRQIIYQQMMVPLRVSMLAEKISTTYLLVSNNHILPAQRNVGQMLQFAQDQTAGGRAALEANLGKAQQTLKATSISASEKIGALVAGEQKKFSDDIDQRLNAIEASIQSVPALAGPVAQNVKLIKDAYVEDVVAAQAEKVKNNPMYNLDDMM